MVSRMGKKMYYRSPSIAEIALRIEHGYGASSENGIEQPDYGGEDNL